MWETIAIPYQCYRIPDGKEDLDPCIDTGSFKSIDTDINKFLLIRPKKLLPECISDPTRYVNASVNPLDALLEIVKLYKQFIEKTENLRRKHASLLGKKNLFNVLFIPFPLKKIHDLEAGIQRYRDFEIVRGIMREMFGMEVLERIEKLLEGERYTRWTCFVLSEKPPYIYGYNKLPDPLYSVLYRADKGFRAFIDELIGRTFRINTRG